jgi:hypothetical protein
VNTGQTLSTLNEVEKRLPARLGYPFIVGVVQKLACGAVQKDRIILLEIFSIDRGGVVSDGRHPGARLVSQILNHLRR